MAYQELRYSKIKLFTEEGRSNTNVVLLFVMVERLRLEPFPCGLALLDTLLRA